MDAPWLELVNSNFSDYRGSGGREDRLEDDKWLAGFLKGWGVSSTSLPGRTERRRLRDLRTLLARVVATCVRARTVRPMDLRALNGFLARQTGSRRIERRHSGYGLSFVSGDSGIADVLADIAASFAEVLVEGDPSRIKLCENADCRWVFYDHSKNRSRRWCDDSSACGSLLRVRRFRERQRNAKNRG